MPAFLQVEHGSFFGLFSSCDLPLFHLYNGDYNNIYLLELLQRLRVTLCKALGIVSSTQ